MTLHGIVQAYCAVHILMCCLIWAALCKGYLHFPKTMMPMILLIPVGGFLLAAMAEFLERRDDRAGRTYDWLDHHQHAMPVRMNPHAEDPELVLPMEEVLRINEPKIRRELILNIIRQEPESCISQLQEACANGDLEVSHYASTAIMELQREYELMTQKAEKEYEKDPGNLRKRQCAINYLQKYLDSGMIDKSIAPAYRERLGSLLETQCSADPLDMESRIRAIENNLALERFEAAEHDSQLLVRQWPDQVQVWWIRLKIAFSVRDEKMMEQTLREIRCNRMYLSPEWMQQLCFWQSTQKEEVVSL